MFLEDGLICQKCGKKYSGDPRYGNLCSKCKNDVEENKKKEWLNKLRKDKSVEERVAWIEEWIYENKNRIGYQGPPILDI